MVMFVTGMTNIRDVIPFHVLHKTLIFNFFRTFNLNMALRQQLTQKLEQRLSPNKIQLMKLLQVPTMELDQRIKQIRGKSSPR